MKRLNIILIEGDVEQISFSTTEKKQEDCASFLLVIDKSKALWSKAHVNAFGEAARVCKRRGVVRGSHVLVFGELMTRPQDGDRRNYSTEVRLVKLFVVEEEAQAIRQLIESVVEDDNESNLDK